MNTREELIHTLFSIPRVSPFVVYDEEADQYELKCSNVDFFLFKELVISKQIMIQFNEEQKLSGNFAAKAIFKHCHGLLEEFYLDLLNFQEADVDVLFVGIRKYMHQFEHFRNLILNLKPIEELASFVKLLHETTGYSRYKDILDDMLHYFVMDAKNWILYGQPFLFSKTRVKLAYDQTFYKDKWTLKKVPYNLEPIRGEIAECGLIAIVLRGTLKGHRRVGLDNLETLRARYCENYSLDNLKKYHAALKHCFNVIIIEELRSEVVAIYKEFFVLDSSKLYEIMDRGEEVTLGNFTYMNIKTRVTDHLMDIILCQKSEKRSNVNFFEGVTIKCKTSGPAEYFFSQKTFFELEIIFRVLFNLHYIHQNTKCEDDRQFMRQLLSFIFYEITSSGKKAFLAVLMEEQAYDTLIELFGKHIGTTLVKIGLSNTAFFTAFLKYMDCKLDEISQEREIDTSEYFKVMYEFYFTQNAHNLFEVVTYINNKNLGLKKGLEKNSVT